MDLGSGEFWWVLVGSGWFWWVLVGSGGRLGSFWEPLKTEVSVDYSLRMERLLFRPGWVEGVWEAFGSLSKRRLCRLQSLYGTAAF